MTLTQPTQTTANAPRAPRARQMRRRLGVLAVILLAAVGFLLYKTLTSAIVYFKTASEAVAARASLGDTTFQIEGVVVRHSVHHRGPGALRFEIESNNTRVEVDNSGSPPQLFQPGIPVVLVGHFVGSSNLFASDQILVKHSNQYIAAHPSRVRAPDGSTR